MLHSSPEWRAFEREQIRRERPDYARSLAAFEELYQHACALGAFDRQDLLRGLDHDIRLVKALESIAQPPAG